MNLSKPLALVGALAFMLSGAPAFAQDSQSTDTGDGSLLNQPAEKTLNQPIEKTVDQAGQDIQETVQPQKTQVKDADFLNKAAQLSADEIEMAKLAQQNAQSDQVKAYAKQLEQDHQAVTDELKQVATQLKTEEPAVKPSDKAEMKRKEMSAKTGTAFDQAFIDQQVKAQDKAIKAFEKESKEGKTPELKEFAANQLPKLREHQQKAQQLKQQM